MPKQGATFRLPQELLDELKTVTNHMKSRGLVPDKQVSIVIQALWAYLPQIKAQVAMFDQQVGRTPPEGYAETAEAVFGVAAIHQLDQQLKDITNEESNYLDHEIERGSRPSPEFPDLPQPPGGIYRPRD